jgi:hypothetical protein
MAKDAHTLEAAMQIEDPMRQMLAVVSGAAVLTSAGDLAR